MEKIHSSRYPLKRSRYSSHSLLLAHFPEPGNGKRVLDLGCGDGYLSEILASRGYQVVGVERAGGNSRPFPDSVQLIQADLEQGLPPLPGTFDVVLCADILEHLRDPAELLRQVHRAMAPGGALIASLPNSGNLYFRLVVLLGRFPLDDRGLFDRTHLRFFTWEGWLYIFRQGGFRFTRVESSGLPVGLQFPRWENTLPIQWAEALCYGFASLRKQMFAYQFVVEAKPEASHS